MPKSLCRATTRVDERPTPCALGIFFTGFWQSCRRTSQFENLAAAYKRERICKTRTHPLTFKQSPHKKTPFNQAKVRFRHVASTLSRIDVSIIAMAAQMSVKAPVNSCDWRTGKRADGTTYRYKLSDCQQATCKYSAAYVPPKK